MTAAELFEVVKDVPREAWPTTTTIKYYAEDFDWWCTDRCHYVGSNVACLMFEASMAAWLARRTWIVKHEYYESEGPDDTTNGGWRVDRCGGGVFEAPTRVAALAAACKEAA